MLLKYMNNLYQILYKQVKSNPYKTAVIVKGIEYKYTGINDSVIKLYSWFVNNNSLLNERVLFYGNNGIEFIISLFATNKVSGTFVPIAPNVNIERLRFIISDCSPKIIFIEKQLLNNKILKLLEKLNITCIVIGKQITNQNILFWNKIMQTEFPSINISNKKDDLALIIYTSGTTSFPKGIMSLNSQIIFVSQAINSVIQNKKTDIILCGLPFSFDYGLYQIFLSFLVGATLVIEDFYYLMSIPKLLINYKITGFPIVPSIIISLVKSGSIDKQKLPDLRYITSTGDTLPIEIIQYLNANFPNIFVYPMYGLTECKRVSIMPIEKLKNNESSVGLPLPNTSVKIIDEQGNEVQPNVTGELIVEGQHIMEGYWNNKEKTQNKFRIDTSTGKKTLFTGDYFHRDENNFLYFDGRKENFIKSKGQKISPKEIECLLNKYEYIESSIVIGVPDYILGEAIFVFVRVLKNINVNKQQILLDCQKKLPKEYFPKYIKIMTDEFPLTTNGKIDRKKLKNVAVKETNYNV